MGFVVMLSLVINRHFDGWFPGERPRKIRGQLPRYPRQRTCAAQLVMSALGHKRTFQSYRRRYAFGGMITISLRGFSSQISFAHVSISAIEIESKQSDKSTPLPRKLDHPPLINLRGEAMPLTGDVPVS